MKKDWNGRKFIALFMAVAMVFASGVFVTTRSFQAYDGENGGESTEESVEVEFGDGNKDIDDENGSDDENFTTDGTEISSNDEDNDNGNDESDNDENSDESDQTETMKESVKDAVEIEEDTVSNSDTEAEQQPTENTENTEAVLGTDETEQPADEVPAEEISSETPAEEPAPVAESEQPEEPQVEETPMEEQPEQQEIETVTIYEITAHFNLNGGKGTTPDDVTGQSENESTVEISLPSAKGITKEGLVFAGWSEDENAESGNTDTYSVTVGESESATDEDTAAGDGQTETTESSQTDATAENNQQTPVQESQTITKEITLYAIWSQPKTYTVKFDLYGGTGTTPESITVTQPTDGSEVYVQMPAQGDIAKEGYTFAGWTKNPEEYVAGKGYGWNATYYDPDDGDSKTTTDMMHITASDSEEITLYPAWLPTKSRGGFIYFAIRRDGTLMTEPAVYDGAEYTFLSRKEYYYETMKDVEKRVDQDNEGNKETNWSYDSDSFPTVDVDLYLSPLATEANLGRVNTHMTEFAKKRVAEVNQDHYDKTGEWFWNPETEYVVWYVIKDQAGDWNGWGDWHIDGVVRSYEDLYLNYEPNCNDYKGQAPVSVPHKGDKDGKTVVAVEGSNTLERTGYTFGGWNTKVDGTGKGYKEGSEITLQKDETTKNTTTLYAQWIPNGNTPYAIEYYDADTGELINTVSRYDKTDKQVAVEETDKVLDGYIFDKDNENNVTEGMVAADGSLVLKLFFDKTHSVKITAVEGSKPYDGAEVEKKDLLASVTVDGNAADNVSVTDNAITFTYNDKEYTATGVSIATQKDGEAAAVKEIGEYDIILSGADGATVTKAGKVMQYTVATEDGTYDVTKRTIVLTSGSGEWKYDGKEHKAETVEVTGDGWLASDEPEYSFVGVQRAPGESENFFIKKQDIGRKATNWEEDYPNYDIEVKYGTLKVTSDEAKYDITIRPDTMTLIYDGIKHAAGDDAFTIAGTDGTVKDISAVEKIGDLLTRTSTHKFTMNGNEYTLTGLKAIGNGIAAGTYPIGIEGTEKITDEDGNDVTGLFNVKTETGSLEIAARTLQLRSVSKSKTYDGKELTNGDEELIVGGNGLAEADKSSFTYTFTGSQTEVGASSNSFTYELAHTDCYDIVTGFGTLEVKPVATATDDDGKHTLIIHYVGDDGKKQADDYEETYDEGDRFKIETPKISGYEPEFTYVASDELGMPGQDVEVTVGGSTRKPQGKSAGSNGGNGNRGNDNGGAVVTTMNDGDSQLITAADAQTPLANFGLDGDHKCNVLAFLILLATMGVIIAYTDNMKKHQSRIFELRDALENEKLRKEK